MKISTSWHFPDQVSEQRGGEVHHQCTAVATSLLLLLLQQTSVQGETELEATAGKRPSCSQRTAGFLADILKTCTDKRSYFESTWGNSMESWKTPSGVMSLQIHRQRLQHIHFQSSSTEHRFLKGCFNQNNVYGNKHPTSVVPRNVPVPRYHVQCGPVLLLMGLPATLASCK